MELSKKDKRILLELGDNSRLSNSQIAKRVGVSASNTSYRINKLITEKIIDEFYLLLNPFALNGRYDRLLVKFRADWDIEEVKAYCKEKKTIGWYIVFDGDWNFGCQLWGKTTADLNKTVKEFLTRFGQSIIEYAFSSVVSIHKYEYCFILPEIKTEITSIHPQKAVDLDDIDRSILLAMYRNARQKLLGVAKEIRQSNKLVEYRLKRMNNLGVIVGYKLNLNRFNLGYDYYKVRLEFSTFDEVEIRALKETLMQDKRVMFITEALGWADLEFEIFCKDQKEYRGFQNEFRKRFVKCLKTYETLIPLEFNWNHILP